MKQGVTVVRWGFWRGLENSTPDMMRYLEGVGVNSRGWGFWKGLEAFPECWLPCRRNVEDWLDQGVHCLSLGSL